MTALRYYMVMSQKGEVCNVCYGLTLSYHPILLPERKEHWHDSFHTWKAVIIPLIYSRRNDINSFIYTSTRHQQCTLYAPIYGLWPSIRYNFWSLHFAGIPDYELQEIKAQETKAEQKADRKKAGNQGIDGPLHQVSMLHRGHQRCQQLELTNPVCQMQGLVLEGVDRTCA